MLRELKGTKILVDICGNVQKGENVVVVTDSENEEIADFISSMSLAAGAETVVVSMAPRSNHGENPPSAIAAALMEADVIFAVTTFSLFHSTARINACNNGARWVNMAGYTKDMLKQGGLMVNFPKQRILAEKLADILSNADNVLVKTEKGTDLSFSIKGRKAIPEGGISDKPGMVNSPPDIETCIAPVEGTAQGTVVLDGSIVQPGLGPLSEDVFLKIENGNVTEITGGSEAKLFEQMLKNADDPNVYNIGEFGIGLNPECRLCGSMLEDEGVYRTAHFGIGDNHTMGGTVEASMHTDSIFWEPTVYVDDKQIILKGDLQI